MDSTDQAVLEAVERDVLRVDVLETALAKALDVLTPPQEARDHRTRPLRDELAALDRAPKPGTNARASSLDSASI